MTFEDSEYEELIKKKQELRERLKKDIVKQIKEGKTKTEEEIEELIESSKKTTFSWQNFILYLNKHHNGGFKKIKN